MNDPHVESLIYRVEANSEVIRFENPPPLVYETTAFRLRLEDGALTIEMKEHYPTVQKARTCVESYLKDWTLFSALEFDVMLDFIFETARQIDRNPPLPGQATGEAYLVENSATMQAEGSLTPFVRMAYPIPPSGFEASPDVEVMWCRYRRHIEEKEPLASMAYFCLTVLEWSTNRKKDKRAKAAQMYNIDKKVLSDLGALTVDRGTPLEARKRGTGATLVPLTDAEQCWVRQAVKRIIRRKGEYDYDPVNGTSLPQITMADLPKI
jgi:hypothetical protein